MGKIETYTAFAESIANDNSHGYSQYSRWGTPDYDCSSLVITAVENAGIPVKTNGATYTGNMYNVFIKCGFKDVTSSVNRSTGANMQRGDILLNTVNHTAIYCGNGKLVQASCSETGGISGTAGDQTGNEINIKAYYNYPWNYVLRYPETETRTETKSFIFVNYTCFGKSCQVTGFFEDNENWIKARDALEAVGYTVGWDSANKSVTATKNGLITTLNIRTYISASNISFCPLRDLYEYLGFTVTWDNEKKTIVVTI